MSGFASVAKSYDIGLKERPFYRSQRGGLSELEQFGMQATQRYMQNASRIRDSRFARSRTYDMDTAIKENREKVISDTIHNSTDPRQLAGLHGRVRANLTRTGDSLASFKPSLKTGDLPESLSDSSLAKRDVMEIVHRAKQSTLVSMAKAHDANVLSADYKRLYESPMWNDSFFSAFDTFDQSKTQSPATSSAKSVAPTATSRLASKGTVGMHYAPPRVNFAEMNGNERRRYQSALLFARQRGMTPNSAEFSNFMARQLKNIRTGQSYRKEIGVSAGAMSTSPRRLKNGKVIGGGGVRKTKTSKSVRKPLSERTAVPAERLDDVNVYAMTTAPSPSKSLTSL